MDEDETVYMPETTCSLCNAEFLDAEDLEIHFTQVHSKKCQVCSSSYTDLLDYALHIRDKHIAKLKSCSYCSKVFLKKIDWQNHVKKHVCNYDSKLYNCSQCLQIYNNKHELEQHEYENHNNNSDGVILYECFQELSSVLNIKASVFLQSLGSTANYFCIQCHLQTSDIRQFIKHLKDRNCRSYVCFQCSNVHKTKKSLTRHIINHKTYTDEIKLTKKCTVCEKDISNLLYNKHKSYCKPIECHKCHATFKTVYELGAHQTEKHPSSLALKTCKFCQRECVGKGVLEKHIERTHKDQLHLYKYLCIYCNLPFKHPQKLFAHFYTRHKDLEPYTCQICDKKFRIRKRFTLHIKLEHKSIGFVEFEENYHVYFTEKKPENPFKPYSIYDNEYLSHSDREDDKKSKKNTTLVNVASDFVTATETEDNQTDAELEVKRKTLKRKSTAKRTVYTKRAKRNEIVIPDQSSDDEPLQVLKERTRKRPKKRSKIPKKKFTCAICNKYCYTFQKYHNHILLHSRSDKKICIKCSKTFKSITELETHMARDHSSSQLTDTLKNLIEKRKLGMNTLKDLTMTERFRRTIRAVCCDKTNPATLTELPNDGLSVQKFIESFTPEETGKKDINIQNNVTITAVKDPYVPKQVIKMKKFQPILYNTPVRLALPVKFKQNYTDKVITKIKLVQEHSRKGKNFVIKPQIIANKHIPDDQNNLNDRFDGNNSDDTDKAENIPDVAEEIMLENTEDILPAPASHKIIIPKLPDGYNQVQIAHMIPEAPFFKIIKFNTEPEKDEKKKETIKLPDGTKLVTVNPLAHLLGDKPVDEILTPKRSYYKPKTKDFESVVAKALSKLENPSKAVNKGKKSKVVTGEQ